VGPERSVRDLHVPLPRVILPWACRSTSPLGTALADGVDVRRYFVWSLLDSFEWELGYGAPFGLIHVDVATQERAPKRSAHWYRDFIARARSHQHG
jgi:beta-glucosidase/6-phospho-beta-glucosidase/beta-galactosidase